jgi:Rieske Fe-S protein
MTDRDELVAVPSTTRRGLLLGAGALGAVGVLAACGDSSTPTSTGPAATPAPTTPPPIKVSDIPVGGGKIYPDLSAVVVQPTAGAYKAFDSTCQHAGCTVGTVAGGLITCPCHGSQYSITDGSVKRGPSAKPLPPKAITVSGDTIIVS